MTRKELVEKYHTFFQNQGHQIIDNASLIPENDPSVLFTNAGMHPLVPYLLGESHPRGRRLVNLQKCLRTVDIEAVGDPVHLTFFEMLGNWSLGGYWKQEAIAWAWEFLTSRGWLNIDAKRLWVSVFAGDQDTPRDIESFDYWQRTGIDKNKIVFLGRKDNFWGPVGASGPCGPDTEIFYDTGKPPCGPTCGLSCDCGKYVEIWNLVFMEYARTAERTYEPLTQRNVDTGMGVERTLMALTGVFSIFETELLYPIFSEITKGIADQESRAARIITDHLRAATFILAEGVAPSNLDRGYVLRRLIRKSIRQAKKINLSLPVMRRIIEQIIRIHQPFYPLLSEQQAFIIEQFNREADKFSQALSEGLAVLNKFLEKRPMSVIPGSTVFTLYASYGFPLEIIKEIAAERGISVDEQGFAVEYEKHRSVSRHGAEKKFKGGLGEITEETTKLHTVTHLLHQALREILGEEVQQRGSNITPVRLRFDFSYPHKLSGEQIKNVESLVNHKIDEAIPVTSEEMTPDEAHRRGAIGLFEKKYGPTVKVYGIGDFSREICGGPHAENTKLLGHFRIIKEEASSAGVRRIKAVLE